MKFYFPDSQDLVSPTYDFKRDEYSPLRVRQRDDKYAHEVLTKPAYQGLLVSKAIVDGSVSGVGKYTGAQRQRLFRLGVRGFFRLPDDVATIGDCGAFSYVNEHIPPYTTDEMLDFYEQCGFDSGVSIDHVILGYQRPTMIAKPPPPEWVERREISLKNGFDFIETAQARKSTVEPVGAAQGWDPESYADSVQQLQSFGYKRIALGGMVPLKTPDILDCLMSIDEIRNPGVELHLLGVTRFEAISKFARLGVTSFDSTSAFRQSFMDDRDNYHTDTGAYSAIRVPQVDGNIMLKRAILSGQVSQQQAIHSERAALKALRAFDSNSSTLQHALEALGEYEQVIAVKKSYLDLYEQILTAAPWKTCPCGLCEKHGIEIAIFRGTERNKRRGFHNLAVLASKMSTLPKPGRRKTSRV